MKETIIGNEILPLENFLETVVEYRNPYKVLVRVDDADALYSHVRSHGIIVRNRNRVEKCLGCLRITVGTCNENDQLINAMLKYEKR